jgi:hypothetical protein
MVVNLVAAPPPVAFYSSPTNFGTDTRLLDY